ncbi:phosphate ABC transporter ATP-binding protein PstB [Roseovarius salinarum]|uniref:phosphate ABC transporter ATP-binding protein PstB n=1 Tax=Roseovarius salinarum TaxID=1981892 RepID=UPI000C34D508
METTLEKPETAPDRAAAGHETKMECSEVNVFYGDFHAIRDATLNVHAREVLALMGPSGCGKTTFLRCLNRMNDAIENSRVTGRILLDGQDIYAPAIDPVHIRTRVGMVAQAPNPFPKSVYDNIAFGPRLHGFVKGRAEMDQLVEHSLRRAGLWDEVKDKLDERGTDLSGGQQQRLCIARAIANDPEVLLMDEPVSSLDPNAAAIIEDLITELSEDYSIVLITHSMEQTRRVADRTAFFYLGEIAEIGITQDVFDNPRDPRTVDFIRGAFG